MRQTSFSSIQIVRAFFGHPVGRHAYLKMLKLSQARTMVLILDGNSEIGVHVLSDLGYLICLRRCLDRVFFFYKIPDFLHALAKCSE